MGFLSFSLPLPLTGVDNLLAPLLAFDRPRVHPFGTGVKDLVESVGVAIADMVCLCLRVDIVDDNVSFVPSGTLDE